MATNRNRRKFVWARAFGTLHAAAGDTFGGTDLLAAVKDRYGGDVLVGATVMAVRGYIAPWGLALLGTEPVAFGRTGIRVCNQGDATAPIQASDTPGSPGNFAGDVVGDPEADWMGFFPWRVGETPTAPNATWNHAGNAYGVDLRSARRMEELGQTLGLFSAYWTSQRAAEDTVPLDFDLSIGVKLA